MLRFIKNFFFLFGLWAITCHVFASVLKDVQDTNTHLILSKQNPVQLKEEYKKNDQQECSFESVSSNYFFIAKCFSELIFPKYFIPAHPAGDRRSVFKKEYLFVFSGQSPPLTS